MGNQLKIIGFCEYCRGSIHEGEPYSVDEKGDKFHDYCKEQKNTYYDPFDVGE